MPAGLLPNVGIADQLSYILSATITGVLPWSMLMFKNNIVPTKDTVLADLVESDWSGYSRLSLSRGVWMTPVVTGNCARSTWGTDPQVWIPSGGAGQKVYGVAYLDITTGRLRFVQRLDTPDIVDVEVGVPISILPAYTLTSAACGS